MFRAAKTRKVLRTILFVALLITVLHVVPIPPIGEPVETIAWSDSRFVEVYGIKVHYVEKGSGDVMLVLLHGFGASVFTWRSVMENLTVLGRVVAFDRPGFGLTERVEPSKPPINPYNIEGVVELTCKFVELVSKGESRVVLVGHSQGGGIAVLAALRCKLPVVALVLVAPSWKPHTPPIHERVLYNLPLADKYGPLVARLMIGRLEETLFRAWYNKSLLTSEVVEGYKYPLKARDWDRGLYWLIKYRGFPDVRGELENIRIPVLIVHGLNDEIVPVVDSRELAVILSTVTSVELVLVENCGHIPHEEKPVEFTRAVLGFLEKVLRGI